jgi:HSP20 family protein
MAIIRFGDRSNPWAEFERLRQGLDHFSRNFRPGETPYSGATVFPPLNVYEDSNGVIIKGELPGVAAEHLNISLEGDTLTLKGRREPHPDAQNLSFHRREIQAGNFSRAITLPVRIDPDSVSARLQHGILTISLNKAEEAKPRQVKVVTEEERV